MKIGKKTGKAKEKKSGTNVEKKTKKSQESKRGKNGKRNDKERKPRGLSEEKQAI